MPSHTPESRRNFVKKVSFLGGALGLGSLQSHAAGGPPTQSDYYITKATDSIRVTGIRRVRVELPGPPSPRTWNATKFYGGSTPSAKWFELETDAGIIGRSFYKGPWSLIEGEVYNKLKGQNIMNPEHIWHRLYHHKRKPVAKGEYIMAIGSIDIAIWDIIGKALNLPTYKVLGAFRDRIPVYGAGGYYAEGKTVSDLVKEMEGLVEEGFRVIKMKVGGAPLQEDVERVRAVRQAVGEEIEIMIDANNAFRSYEAITLGRALEPYRPYWFEEPVIPDDYEGSAVVRKALDIPIVSGENEYTKWGVRDMIAAGAIDILNVDTIRGGGYTEYRKLAAYADAHHIPVAPHGHSMMAQHLMASLPNGLIMEVYPKSTFWSNPVFPPPEVKDGHIIIPDHPGIGLEPDWDLVKKYEVPA